MIGSKQKLRRAAAASATTMCMAGLAACGESATSTSTAGEKQATTATAASATSPGVEAATQRLAKYSKADTPFVAPGPAVAGGADVLRGKKVWFIPIFFEAAIFHVAADAMREALEPLGATLQICDAKGNPTGASGCLRQATANGAAGIITDSVPVPFAEQGYAEAVEKKIPVVASNNAIPAPDTPAFDRYFTPISGDFELDGQLVADAVIADSGGKADVLFANNTTTPFTKAIGAAIVGEFKANCPDCKVSEVEVQDTALQKIPSLVQAAMVKNSDAKYVVTQFDTPSGQLVQQGARQARSTTKFAAFGGPLSALKQVKDGSQLADAGTDAVTAGWADVDALVRSAAGAPKGKHEPAVLHRLFTKENLESEGDELTQAAWTAGSWYSDGSFKDEYLRLWGVG